MHFLLPPKQQKKWEEKKLPKPIQEEVIVATVCIMKPQNAVLRRMWRHIEKGKKSPAFTLNFSHLPPLKMWLAMNENFSKGGLKSA